MPTLFRDDHRTEFGAATRRSLALGPGSHSAFAACARESSGASCAQTPQPRFPGRRQRSEAKWKAIRDPAQRLAAKRRRISPFAKVTCRAIRFTHVSFSLLPPPARRSRAGGGVGVGGWLGEAGGRR